MQHKDTTFEFDPAQLQEGLLESIQSEDEIEQSYTQDTYMAALEMAAFFCGLHILQSTGGDRVAYERYKELFDTMIKNIQKYRPDKFWLGQLDDIKKSVDALDLDEAT